MTRRCAPHDCAGGRTARSVSRHRRYGLQNTASIVEMLQICRQLGRLLVAPVAQRPLARVRPHRRMALRVTNEVEITNHGGLSLVILDPVGRRRHSPPSAAQTGDRFDVGDKLGAGGMGAVFRAFDHQRQIHVALKDPAADRRTRGLPIQARVSFARRRRAPKSGHALRALHRRRRVVLYDGAR